MGTSYYRIPSSEEMEERLDYLKRSIQSMEVNPVQIINGFKMDDRIDEANPWEKFIEDTLVHIGKRVGGRKFLWNFKNDQYYNNNIELFKFIRSGRVVNEYYEEVEVEEFITMASEWGQLDSLDLKNKAG